MFVCVVMRAHKGGGHLSVFGTTREAFVALRDVAVKTGSADDESRPLVSMSRACKWRDELINA